MLCGREEISIPLITQHLENDGSCIIVLNTSIKPANYKSCIDIIVRNQKSEAATGTQGAVEGLKDLEGRTAILVADSLVSVNDPYSQLRTANR